MNSDQGAPKQTVAKPCKNATTPKRGKRRRLSKGPDSLSKGTDSLSKGTDSLIIGSRTREVIDLT
jgi:hypothetical protein